MGMYALVEDKMNGIENELARFNLTLEDLNPKDDWTLDDYERALSKVTD